MTWSSLDEALSLGRGEERPFRCHMHDDTNASASVNVAKMVWYCYACGASGTTDGKAKAPSADDLAAMLGTTGGVRVYPENWLMMFTSQDWEDTYWSTRFPAWIGAHLQLGQDPFSGDATFPVHTPEGRLAGVGRRLAHPEDGRRYLYPRRWSAARSLFGWGLSPPDDVVVLAEGAADATSLIEVGVRAYGCYGAGLHAPQRELVLRASPRVVIAAFDNDTAGDTAAARLVDDLSEHATVVRAHWESDPAAATPHERRVVLAVALAECEHRRPRDSFKKWKHNVEGLQAYRERA